MACDLLQKIELMRAAGAVFTPQDGKEVVRTFYDVLTVLDTKGLALLAFDGIIVAATTFAAENMPPRFQRMRESPKARWATGAR